MNIKVEIQRNPSIRGWDVWIMTEAKDGSFGLAKPILFDFQELKDGMYSEPTIQISETGRSFFSSFAEALAITGFKSDELLNTNKEIDAISYHLEDMRRLVFKDVSRKS